MHVYFHKNKNNNIPSPPCFSPILSVPLAGWLRVGLTFRKTTPAHAVYYDNIFKHNHPLFWSCTCMCIQLNNAAPFENIFKHQRYEKKPKQIDMAASKEERMSGLRSNTLISISLFRTKFSIHPSYNWAIFHN